ncbi:hypothetical protein N7451_001716 [Penicillium sp. IBT 35674x]|nr:hypothetical protein N7451_001716 [Penicillium sp. IBT 35674x]
MSDNELPSSFLYDVDLQGSLFPDLPDLTNDDGLALSPLDRWKNSPPETEAVAYNAVIDGLAAHRHQLLRPSQPDLVPRAAQRHQLTALGQTCRARAPLEDFMRKYQHGADADASVTSHLCPVVVLNHQNDFTNAPFAQTRSGQNMIG